MAICRGACGADVCADMSIDMCIHMHTDMCINMCIVKIMSIVDPRWMLYAVKHGKARSSSMALACSHYVSAVP